MRKLYMIFCFIHLSVCAFSQQYTGMNGLIHVPSADMDEAGDFRIGTHYLNKHFLPDEAFDYDGKYHSWDFYASITPFSWIEIGYTFTLRKGNRGDWGPDDIGYHRKDQYFSLKLRPLEEKKGKWWPGIAIGTNDPYTGGDKGQEQEKNRNQIFGNYYAAMTKHIWFGQHVFGAHLAYRRYRRSYNDKWNGIVGGITYQPGFAPNLRGIVEYTGDDINIGADCLLWKHLRMQVSLQRGKYFTGGICYQANLF